MQWSTVINVNLTGQFLCARAAVREFLRRGRRPEVSRALGKIICMSSVHEVIPWAGHANYAASKGGVMMLMKAIAQELAPRGIRVNGLAPGATRTPINTPTWSLSEDLGAQRLLLRLEGRGFPARAYPDAGQDRRGDVPRREPWAAARLCGWQARQPRTRFLAGRGSLSSADFLLVARSLQHRWSGRGEHSGARRLGRCPGCRPSAGSDRHYCSGAARRLESPAAR